MPWNIGYSCRTALLKYYVYNLLQEKVACLDDNDARLALDPKNKYRIQVLILCIIFHKCRSISMILVSKSQSLCNLTNVNYSVRFKKLTLFGFFRQNHMAMVMCIPFFIPVAF